ncbi:hypothetical protein A9Q96_06775 [Rhodobacterales bacterium 52_120_T64]|nr:hypothetical protein A9Q96_06775 [Rhodobacterales bacterium 52_120_T64]
MSETAFTAAEIENMFTNEGRYIFARWSRPIAPVVFGTDDESLAVFKDAFATVASLGDMLLAETDPELGANFLVFLCTDWSEIKEVPNLNRLLANVDDLVTELDRTGANQYRSFAFDPTGAIKLCVLLLKYDDDMAKISAQALATGQMAQAMLLWSPAAFLKKSPIGIIEANNMAIVRPAVAALIRAAYDKTMPDTASDVSHALRLEARVVQLMGGDC